MAPAMEFRALGAMSEKVPVVCLGTMTFGEQNSREESFAILDRALERGVNFFDVAELYPVPPRERDRTMLSEQIIGDWLTARSDDDPDLRKRLIIATKVASRLPGVGPRGFIVQNRYDSPEAATAAGADKIECPDLTREQVLTACDASLKRLQCGGVIDLYQLHWPSRYAPVFGKRQYDYSLASADGADGAAIEESVAALGELIKAGKIRYWGVSNETPYGLCKFAEAAKKLGVPPPVSIQNDYSLLDREFDGGNAEACHPKNLNIGLIAYGCLAGGGLTGKYLNGAKPAGARHTLFPGFQPRYVNERATAATADYAALAEKKGLTPTTLALAWAASRPFMASVIIGATNLKQLDECIDACLTKLDDDTLREIEALYLKHGSCVLTD